MIGVTGDAAQGIVGDHRVRLELKDDLDEAADGVVDVRVDQSQSSGRGLRHPLIRVAEQARGACPQQCDGVGEFGRPTGPLGPGRGDDQRAVAARGGASEDAARREGLVVGVREHRQDVAEVCHEPEYRTGLWMTRSRSAEGRHDGAHAYTTARRRAGRRPRLGARSPS